ncbi:MAG: hypothetical protein IKE46_10230 [Selenomonadaceae bacterium]|nr:hypothetical protein [Selenomonadaceae bacterium]
MTTLRQEAISIVESLPEEKILTLLNFLRELTDFTDTAKRLAKKKAAFDELETLRREIPDLNYDKALADYRNEKFGNANSD